MTSYPDSFAERVNIDIAALSEALCNETRKTRSREISTEDLLVGLISECAEVIHAVTKAQQFGVGNTWDGVTNAERLAEEIGDVWGIATELAARGVLDFGEVMRRSAGKIERMQRAATK
jgi:NTP pyrophosphatase (non-canonical NTP hydrolase)